jgi:hypothetical protein
VTIRPGEDWGRRIPGPVSALRVADDASAAANRGGRVVLTGGDLHRVLGAPGSPDTDGDCTELEVDLLEVVIERRDGGGETMWAASSVVAGNWRRRGRVTAVLNTGFLGRRNLAPRAHPNDGVFEVLEVDRTMPRRERREALRRSLTGSHLPHPLIGLGRADSWDIERRGPLDTLRIDGVIVRGWCSVRVTLHPDALLVVV